MSLLVLSAWGVYATLTGVNSILIWDFHRPWTALHAMLREVANPYSPEHLLWQRRVINPVRPIGLTIALLALSPRMAQGDIR
jgi:hypothetical protein